MRQLALLLLGTTALIACAPKADNASAAKPAITAEMIDAETARLNEWFEARYEEQLEFSPITKTILGRKEQYDEFDDFSEAAEEAQLAWRAQTALELEANFDREKLTPEAQTSYDIWLYETGRAQAGVPFRRRGYVFTQMQGVHAQLPTILINFHRVDELSDMQAYIARVGGVSRAIDQLVERAGFAAAEGVRPPYFTYDVVARESRALITGAPFGGAGDSPVMADANRKIEALLTAGKIDAAQAEDLRAQTAAVLTTAFKPAYERLITFVEAEKPKADAVATGVWKLPEGRDFYAYQLAGVTTTALTPDEVHEIGLSEVARIRSEMEAIKAKVGFTGTLEEFFTFVREDKQFYYPNTDAGREAYLQAARDHLGFINSKLPEYFGILPKAPLEVKRVEAFREQPGAAQHYFPGTPDGSRPGIYYAHLADMAAMPIPQLEVIAYHEGNPGHHMQISIAQELTSVPEFRTQSSFTAYIEGWALYSELLAKEMGAYQDPYSDFGRLTTEIWRAIRLVVDTGLHNKEWTEEQAVAYFKANSPAAEGQIRSEVQRYIVIPGQATGYKIGMLKILELRARAEASLGENFDIRGFHDTVLGGGALPLSILETRVDGWIASRKAAAQGG